MTGFMITISYCHSNLTWLVSGSVATQIMTGFMITISSCHSSLTWLVSGSVATQIMTGLKSSVSTFSLYWIFSPLG